MKNLIRPSLGLTASAMMSTLSFGELLVLEQFDYEGTDTLLNGSDGGIGFDGAWEVVGWSRPYDIGRTSFAIGDSSMIVNDRGGLDFEGHPSAGTALSRFGTAGQQEAHRTLTAEVQTALTADNTTIWFSVLACAPAGNKFGSIIFGTDPMLAVQGGTENGNLSSATGQAFGMGFRVDNGGLFGSGTGSPNAVAFVNSASATISEGTYLPPFADGASHHEVSLVVGKINWKPNGTEDELFLFNITPDGNPEPSEENAIASLTADFDQTNFTLLSLQDTGSTIFDEIRFGTTFADVSPGVAAFKDPVITQIDYSLENNEVTLSWTSVPDNIYVVKYSTDLIDWENDLDDGVVGDAGEITTKTFGLSGPFATPAPRLFFRIER